MTEHITHKVDTHSYKGWLNSDSFLKRAFAVLGYNTVAGLIVSIPIYIIMFVFAFAMFSMIGLSQGGNFNNRAHHANTPMMDNYDYGSTDYVDSPTNNTTIK